MKNHVVERRVESTFPSRFSQPLEKKHFKMRDHAYAPTSLQHWLQLAYNISPYFYKYEDHGGNFLMLLEKHDNMLILQEMCWLCRDLVTQMRKSFFMMNLEMPMSWYKNLIRIQNMLRRGEHPLQPHQDLNVEGPKHRLPEFRV